MQRLALCAALLLALTAPPAAANSRTCFCELRTGSFTFAPLLLEVDDPVLSGFLITCRKARLWCPQACYDAAKAQLLAGGSGDVSPLEGAAGMTACQALARNVTAETIPPVHVYATYRVSNCGDSGFHYFGRLCCWQYRLGRMSIFKFNEGCQCGPAPPCDEQQLLETRVA